ncbi:MAG: hypothetical protein OXH90_02820 [Paracoccaceae bacterium]|nr:hypothetical protein [Paracoccaceae bacterium]MDE2916518.1 hypothetical protein [Paracoccaceae bacterium]
MEYESSKSKINDHFAFKRCTRCWGNIKTVLADNKVKEMCCINCGIRFEGEQAGLEYDRMQKETRKNMFNLILLGKSPKYGGGAFFEKIFPPRDAIFKEELDESIARKPSVGRNQEKITRREFPEGTPGLLFAQADLLMTGLETKPYSIPKLFEPNDNIIGSESILESFPLDGPEELSVRKNIGSTIIESIVSAFSCELAMKAILLLISDEAPKTHDLWKLFSTLPDKSKSRLVMDFPAIAETLKTARETFGREKYFEIDNGSNYLLKLLNPVFSLHLGKSARIIIDEAFLLGLDYKVKIETNKKEKVVGEYLDTTVKGHINIVGREWSPRNAQSID